MNCKNCGAEIYEGSAFCGNCGMKVAEEPVVCEAAVNEEQTSGEYKEQGYYEAQPVENMYAETMVPAEKPNTVLWIVLSAVEIFTCCTITGIVSLIYAILGHIAAEKGEFFDAEKKVKTAKTWFWIGLGLGILSIVLYIVLIAVGVAAGMAEEFLYY